MSGPSTDSGSLLFVLFVSGKPSQDSENEQNSVALEVLLVKVCHKKRKVCVWYLLAAGVNIFDDFSSFKRGPSPVFFRTEIQLKCLSSCPGCELSGEAGPYREEAGSSEPRYRRRSPGQAGLLPHPAGSQQRV